MYHLRLHWTLHPEKAKGLYYDAEGRPRSPWYDNEIKKKKMTEDAVARELDIDYNLSVKGVVFKSFRKHHIWHGEYKVNPDLPVIRTIDYGGTCACLFSQKDNYGRVIFFHEIVIQGGGDANKLGHRIQSYSANLECQGFHDYDDPAGQNDDWVSGHKSAEIIATYGINPTHRASKASPHRRKDRIAMINHFLRQVEDEGAIFQVHESCKITIEAFESGYRHPENTDGSIDFEAVDEQHPDEDVMDCVGMTLMEEFSVVKPNPDIRPKSIKANRNRITGY